MGYRVGSNSITPKRSVAPRTSDWRSDSQKTGEMLREAHKRAVDAAKANDAGDYTGVSKSPGATAAEKPTESEEDLPVGTRRKNGTIVGGASWNPMVKQSALGLLESMVADFVRDAKLHPELERRLRKQMDEYVTGGLQISAEFLNGDVSGDQAYEQLEKMGQDAERFMAGVLDQEQMKVYDRFGKGLVDFIHKNVVANDLATLKSKLELDDTQVRSIEKIVGFRYHKIQERVDVPLPNVFFRPIRRDRDADLFESSAEQIRSLLTPEQKKTFDRMEKNANQDLAVYRRMLVPK